MKRWKLLLVATVLVIVTSEIIWQWAFLPDIYLSCDEVGAFGGERLELHRGRFRLWAYSDAESDRRISYPLSGPYTVSGNFITLVNDKLTTQESIRVSAQVNGIHVLWTKDSWQDWTRTQSIHPYSILIKASRPLLPFLMPNKPSIRLLQNSATDPTIRLDYRSIGLSKECLLLLEASRMPMSDTTAEYLARREIYRVELQKARSTVKIDLIEQLVGLMGAGSRWYYEAERVVRDIYKPWLSSELENSSEAGGALDLESTKGRQIAILIEALSAAPDRDALERTLLIIMKACGIPRLEVLVPEAGVKVGLEISPGNIKMSSGSLEGSSRQPTSPRWEKEIAQVSDACQHWLRERLKVH